MEKELIEKWRKLTVEEQQKVVKFIESMLEEKSEVSSKSSQRKARLKFKEEDLYTVETGGIGTRHLFMWGRKK